MDKSALLARLVGTPGDPVPAVDVADLNAVWREFKEAKADHPDGSVGIGMGLLEHVCSRGADMRAVRFRAMQLGLLTMLPLHARPEFAPLMQKGKLTQAALKVAARFPMKWPPAEGDHPASFDLEAFIAEVRKEMEARK